MSSHAPGKWSAVRKPPGLLAGGVAAHAPPHMHNVPHLPHLPHVPHVSHMPPMPPPATGGVAPGAGGGLLPHMLPGQGAPPPAGNAVDVLTKRALAVHAPLPEFAVARVGGQDHKPLFRAVATWLPQGYTREGLGHSKMEAKRAAAASMLMLLDLRARRPAAFGGPSAYEDRLPRDHSHGFPPSAPSGRTGGLLGRQQPLGHAGLQQPIQWPVAAPAHVAAPPVAPPPDRVGNGDVPIWQEGGTHPRAHQQQPHQRPHQLNALLETMAKNPAFIQHLHSVNAGTVRPAPPSLQVPASHDAQPPRHGQPPGAAAPLSPALPGKQEEQSRVAPAPAPPVSAPAPAIRSAPAPRPALSTGATEPPPGPGQEQVQSAGPAEAPLPAVSRRHARSSTAVTATATAPTPVTAPVTKLTTSEDNAAGEQASAPPLKKRYQPRPSSPTDAPREASAPSLSVATPVATPPVAEGTPVDGGGFGEMPGIAIPRKRPRVAEPSASLSRHVLVPAPAPAPAPAKPVAVVLFVDVDDVEAMRATVNLAGGPAANALDLQVRAFGPRRSQATDADTFVPDWMSVTRVLVFPSTPMAVQISLAFAAGRDCSLLEAGGGRITIVTAADHYSTLAIPQSVDVVQPQNLDRHLTALQLG
jgi:hypothetical protein